jgi:predicted DNA-binding transcriptional regulator AlpA
MNIQNLLSVKQVCSSLGVSRTWLFLREREGRYPQGLRLTPRCVRYRADLHEQFVRGEWEGA